MQTRNTTRLETRRQANSMISPRRENQAERSYQRPPRYLTSIKPRTAHHVGIQGRGVAPLITEQIVGDSARRRDKKIVGDDLIVASRRIDFGRLMKSWSRVLEAIKHTYRVKYYDSVNIQYDARASKNI